MIGWALLVLVGIGTAGPSVAAPERATCLVCQVKHGEAEVEPVRAVRAHEGRDYGFCSEACAREFTADPVAYLPPIFPRPAPPFALTSLDGSSVSNESLKGGVVLLDFWATWCTPCRKAMPELQALHRRYAARGFTVVGISIDEGGPAKVRKHVKSNRITYPIALDASREPAWEAFRVKAIPAAYLLDREGRIVAQWTGLPADPAAIERHLETLLPRD